MNPNIKKPLQAAGISLLTVWAVIGTALALNPPATPQPPSGFCYAYTQPYVYTPTLVNGVETCYGGTLVSTVPLPQQ